MTIIDCTGPAAASLKWLKRAGYGKAPNGGLPLDELKISYSPKVYYSTLRVRLTAEQIARLPSTDGLTGSPSFFATLPDHHIGEFRDLYTMRTDGGHCMSIVLLKLGFFLAHHFAVDETLCGRYGDGPDLPSSIDELVEFAKSLKMDKPIPDWYYEVLAIFKEAEAALECSRLNMRKSSHVLILKKSF